MQMMQAVAVARVPSLPGAGGTAAGGGAGGGVTGSSSALPAAAAAAAAGGSVEGSESIAGSGAAGEAQLTSATIIQRLLAVPGMQSIGLSRDQLTTLLTTIVDDATVMRVQQVGQRTDLTPQQKDEAVVQVVLARLQPGNS